MVVLPPPRVASRGARRFHRSPLVCSGMLRGSWAQGSTRTGSASAPIRRWGVSPCTGAGPLSESLACRGISLRSGCARFRLGSFCERAPTGSRARSTGAWSWAASWATPVSEAGRATGPS
eukprot:12892813-Alexandrium_andersonii.AAC.1